MHYYIPDRKVGEGQERLREWVFRELGIVKCSPIYVEMFFMKVLTMPLLTFWTEKIGYWVLVWVSYITQRDSGKATKTNFQTQLLVDRPGHCQYITQLLIRIGASVRAISFNLFKSDLNNVAKGFSTVDACKFICTALVDDATESASDMRP